MSFLARKLGTCERLKLASVSLASINSFFSQWKFGSESGTNLCLTPHQIPSSAPVNVGESSPRSPIVRSLFSGFFGQSHFDTTRALGASELAAGMRHHSTQELFKYLVVTASGPDHPGIVSRLSKRILDFGGNVEESRMARLEGHFSILMLVSLTNVHSSRKAEELRSKLLEIEGLQIQTSWTADDRLKNRVPTRKFRRISLRGADNPGLVYNVAEYLASNNINIENLDTATEEAPFGGTVLFMMDGVIAMPVSLPTSELKRELETLMDTLGVDIKVTNMDPERKLEDAREWARRLKSEGPNRYSSQYAQQLAQKLKFSNVM